MVLRRVLEELYGRHQAPTQAAPQGRLIFTPFPQPKGPTMDLASIADKLPTLGDSCLSGFYGDRIRIGAAIFAVVWAPKALGETTGVWLPTYTDVPGARSCFDSMANTRAMAEAGSPIAKWALELEIDGCRDWCIPARDVLELGYRRFKPGSRSNATSFRDGDNASSVPAGYPYTAEAPAQTEVAAFRTGGAEAFEEEWYWSSTQYSDYGAFNQDFDFGFQNGIDKKYEGRVRAVRLIQLTP